MTPPTSDPRPSVPLPRSERAWKRFGKRDGGFCGYQRKFGGFSIGIRFDLRDIWVGAFWKREPLLEHIRHSAGSSMTRTGYFWNVYICLVPCVPIRLSWMADCEPKTVADINRELHAKKARQP